MRVGPISILMALFCAGCAGENLEVVEITLENQACIRDPQSVRVDLYMLGIQESGLCVLSHESGPQGGEATVRVSGDLPGSEAVALVLVSESTSSPDSSATDVSPAHERSVIPREAGPAEKDAGAVLDGPVASDGEPDDADPGPDLGLFPDASAAKRAAQSQSLGACVHCYAIGRLNPSLLTKYVLQLESTDGSCQVPASAFKNLGLPAPSLPPSEGCP